MQIIYGGDSDLVDEDDYQEFTSIFVEGINDSDNQFTGLAAKI